MKHKIKLAPIVASCNKRRYKTRLDALLGLSRCDGSRNGGREETRSYKCDRCNGWHLTSQIQKDQKDKHETYFYTSNSKPTC